MFVGEAGTLWILLFSFWCLLHPICWAKSPWQRSAPSVREENQFEDLPSCVFAPRGKLYSVESVLRAVHDPMNPSNNVVVAVRYRDGVVIVTTLPKSPYMFEEEDEDTNSSSSASVSENLNPTQPNVTHLGTENGTSTLLFGPSSQSYPYNPAPWVQLDSRIWGIAAGPVVDGQILQQRMIQAAKQTRETRGSIQASSLARSLADACQVQSQKATEGKLLACSGLISQHNELWRIDPNGQFWKCNGAVLGRGATVRSEEKLLELLMKRNTPLNTSADDSDLIWTHGEVQSLLDRITEDDALAAATETILNGLNSRDARGQQKDNDEDSKSERIRGISLFGMVISRSKARFLSHKDLVAIVEP